MNFNDLADFFAGRYLKRFIRARWLAAGPKRLDVCAAQFAHWLGLLENRGFAGPDFLRRASCLEIGTGWVMSHALVCHLLGASRVVCSDIEEHAMPSALGRAVSHSCISLVRDILSPFEAHHVLRQRLEAVEKNRNWNFRRLEGLGIDYVAPVDFLNNSVSSSHYLEGFDFIYSNSVLEHVASESVGDLLFNLAGLLKPGGVMLHCIHLEDHLDLARPFDFLAGQAENFGAADESARGNRIRASGWFSEAELTVVRDKSTSLRGELDFSFIYSWTRADRHLPLRIDPEISHKGEDDLRVSHLGLAFRRKPAPSALARSHAICYYFTRLL